MTTWSLDQIRQVRSVRAQGVVDLSFDRQFVEEAAIALRSKLARRIIDMCHPLGVEVHPGDIEFHETTEAAHRKVTARWMPQTRQVELLGGQDDGRTYEFRGAPDGIFDVAVMPSLTMSDYAAEPTSAMTSNHLAFALSGWREGERHWVYAALERG